ncbi:MAG: response regulator transcription factor [Candidatus Schekmanbacteria bacterium]|nr:response regulator transcription factor [Candidatus Schekmanbacteria bacterium]
MAIRVLLCEDHVMFLEFLDGFLSRADFEVVGHAENGFQAVELARKTQPDVVITDLAMPDLNGLDAAQQILEVSPKTKIIALTMHSEDEYVVNALRAGVKGYVLKTQARDDLVRAIREVLRGAVYLSPEVSHLLVDAYLRGDKLSDDPLTPRERQVLQLVAEGKTTREAADILGISVKTVETHRGNIMEKLGIHGTAGLVRYAIRIGLVSA